MNSVNSPFVTDDRAQNDFWLLLFVGALIVGVVLVYLVLLPVICTMLEPIAAEPLC